MGRVAKILGINLFVLVAALVGAELIARQIEGVSASTVPLPVRDAELGWAPKPNASGEIVTDEFLAHVYTNEIGLYDDPIGDSVQSTDLRILALGDSHTAATGVSTNKAWPNVLERILNEELRSNVSVFNAGVGGYSLGQELVRFRKLAGVLNPQIVIVGFSTATDFYDIDRLPDGTFVYGREFGRIYFELNERNELVQRNDLVGVDLKVESTATSSSLGLRDLLGQLAVYRLLKRSQLAFWIGARLRLSNELLWSGSDVALKKRLTQQDQYRLSLATKIMKRLGQEAADEGRIVILLHIPYIAQVYDDIWNASFGGMPESYDRFLATERLRSIADEAGIYFIDALEPMLQEKKKSGARLHFERDAHPNERGHEVIAETILEHLRDHKLISLGN